jgi:deazaflavin-dependent oxidoreductase (nitroreductase family)
MSANDFNDQIVAEFRANDGKVAQFGDSLVLIHHIGAKSGAERVAPVMSWTTDSGWMVAASKAGAPENPGWYHNLIANPDVDLEVSGVGTVPVTAVVLTGDERDAAWSRITSSAPGFAEYEKRTTRKIPVVEFRRRDS